jgi:hypothetical protein
MKPGKAAMVRNEMVRTCIVRTCVCLLFLLASLPAYSQRGNLDLNIGETRDQFGAQAPVTGTALDLTGELTIKKPNVKKGGPSIVAGGEVRVPSDTGNHAKEFAVYGGLAFTTHNLSIGVNGEVRKILLPPAFVDGQVLNRDNFNLLELPVVIKYKFGPEKRFFIQAHGQPEFTPHYKTSPLSTVPLPRPSFNYGYTVGGSVGYEFGKWWYVKGSYETRYFKFAEGPGNPTSLYNWKSNLATGGVGVRF